MNSSLPSRAISATTAANTLPPANRSLLVSTARPARRVDRHVGAANVQRAASPTNLRELGHLSPAHRRSIFCEARINLSAAA
jgi:hypothetical protein